jgi:hypothetical protein
LFPLCSRPSSSAARRKAYLEDVRPNRGMTEWRSSS